MDKSMKILYDEHELIVNAIDTAQQSGSLLGTNEVRYESTVRSLINFFRAYADRFHHYKEEIILFPEMNRKNELLAEGIIKEMFDNHVEFREMIGAIEAHLNEKKYSKANELLKKYSEALLDHIAVENDEVFQMAETLFSPDELDKIYYRFEDCDRDLGSKKKMELAELANELRKNLLYSE